MELNNGKMSWFQQTILRPEQSPNEKVSIPHDMSVSQNKGKVVVTVKKPNIPNHPTPREAT